MAYVPIHDRVDESRLPRDPLYGPPDLDPSVPMAEHDEYGYSSEAEGLEEVDAGPSRKRRREDESNGEYADYGHDEQQPLSSAHHHPRQQQHQQHPSSVPIQPSIFGIAPRNEFTKTIGEFLMAHCRGVDNVEVEIKLGTLHAQAPEGQQQRRIRMPSMTEMVMPRDYPVGSFASTMTKKQHASFNRLLNQAVEGAAHSPAPLRFYRAQHVDNFHSGPEGKVRVSRDREGNVIRGGVVRKRRLADLNICSPREAFDWRVSASVEDPAEMPHGPALSTRDKDRACYKHQLCQVDLTVVSAKNSPRDPKPTISYELEIEVLDVPALIAEGEKEERGEENRFDDMLQSVLDTARMLIRNV